MNIYGVWTGVNAGKYADHYNVLSSTQEREHNMPATEHDEYHVRCKNES